MDLQPKPAEGAMSSFLPTLIQKPISKLKKLPTVLRVVPVVERQGTSTLLHIHFKPGMKMDYHNAIGCLDVCGLSAKFVNVNVPNRLIKVRLQLAKSLLN